MTDLDLAIIGGGPAALTAAVYAARAGLSVTIFERSKPGGALTEIAHIANFPGFIGSGEELSGNLKEQAVAAGAKIEYGECSEIIRNDADSVITITIDGSPITARTVLIATGSEPKTLPIKTDKPISYCALCDGPLYKNKKVLVVGGGNAAVGEAAYLADVVGEVTLVNRSPLRAESALIKKLKNHKNVKIVEDVDLTVDNEKTMAYLEDCAGIFVFIGKQPATSFLPKEILTSDGLVKTTDYMTSIPGVFAAGDVRDGSIKQAITAAADGAAAAIKIKEYLK